jgi:diaminopimelate epimerase
MQTIFYKYQGTGNDFIFIDNRNNSFPKNDSVLIEKLCNRRFGIGADGLLLLEYDSETDFRMVYFNADGYESSMCGNGGRCMVAFAKMMNLISVETTFMASDGIHKAIIEDHGIVSLQMKDVNEIQLENDFIFLDTGSPHHVMLVDNLDDYDVKSNGAKIRYSERYGKVGSNVNFVTQLSENHFRLRTYERGVEDETLSCGTGATATAIAMHALGKTNANNIILDVEGGRLEVSFHKNSNGYSQVFLKGPATFVYKGEIAW